MEIAYESEVVVGEAGHGLEQDGACRLNVKQLGVELEPDVNIIGTISKSDAIRRNTRETQRGARTYSLRMAR